MNLRNLISFLAVALVAVAFAQDVATSPSSPSPSPTASVAAHARPVRITFLPPPLEGTISLGIYDGTGKLVRVLHREAELSDFEAGADALQTKWDGLDDAGQPAAAGKYHARGYTVGDLQVEETDEATKESGVASNKVSVKLTANPLAADKRPSVELAAGYDEDGTFLETADGLPLFTVDEMPGVSSISLSKRGDKSLEFLQNDGDTTDRFRISNFEQMMAFDCGEIQLK